MLYAGPSCTTKQNSNSQDGPNPNPNLGQSCENRIVQLPPILHQLVGTLYSFGGLYNEHTVCTALYFLYFRSKTVVACKLVSNTNRHVDRQEYLTAVLRTAKITWDPQDRPGYNKCEKHTT